MSGLEGGSYADEYQQSRPPANNRGGADSSGAGPNQKHYGKWEAG
jgi:hypothetical protein